LPGDSITDPASGLPIGPLVNASPARRPERIVLRGRLVTIAPLDPAKHAESLFSGTHGPDKENIWLYLATGRSPIVARFAPILKNAPSRTIRCPLRSCKTRRGRLSDTPPICASRRSIA
jgi:hypothetical protein